LLHKLEDRAEGACVCSHKHYCDYVGNA
jgi:hypothetical protein